MDIVRVEFGEVGTIAEGVTPCIEELTAILDSPLPFELTPAFSYGHDDKPSKLLSLVMFCTLEDSFFTPRADLEKDLRIFMHDFEVLLFFTYSLVYGRPFRYHSTRH